MVAYVGWTDSITVIGPITGKRYQFGLLTRRKGYIDARDVAILGFVEDGKRSFEVGI